MSEHPIEDCTPECFDEKEGITIPAKIRFTDEDLKRLKSTGTFGFQVGWEEIWALIARLEAAEKVAAYGLIFGKCPLALEDKWKTAAGKL